MFLGRCPGTAVFIVASAIPKRFATFAMPFCVLVELVSGQTRFCFLVGRLFYFCSAGKAATDGLSVTVSIPLFQLVLDQFVVVSAFGGKFGVGALLDDTVTILNNKCYFAFRFVRPISIADSLLAHKDANHQSVSICHLR